MQNTDKKLTILEIIKKTTEYLSQRNINNARLNAEFLLSYLLKIDRVQLYLQFERMLTFNEIESYRQLVKRRGYHEPLQYIIGETEFMSLPFKISSSVFIPRPETEILVEKVLALKNQLPTGNTVLWDIGTGSGCIAISIGKFWMGSQVIASDISYPALSCAKENAQLNQVSGQIEFIQHDILHNHILIKECDIIVSNPPYIQKQEFVTLDQEVRNYEPEIALTDSGDGTIFYQRILSLLEEGLECKFILLELSGTQSERIINLTNRFHFNKITIYPDLNKISRVLEIEI
jgi:release factor glutamine methyltransferase